MLWTLLLVAYVFAFTVIPFVLLSGKRPIATLAWIWSILLFPYLGAITYLIIGTDHIKRKKLLCKTFKKTHDQEELLQGNCIPNIGNASLLLRALANINKVPISTAKEVEVLVDAKEFYSTLFRCIEAAKSHIHIEFFIWRADEEGKRFLRALIEAARRGVEVRLLLDQIGCMPLKEEFFQELRAAGGRFSWFYSLPLSRRWTLLNLRNHRKLQIIDGKYAFVDGMNMGEEYTNRAPWPRLWRDVQVKVTGNVLKHLQGIFATDWYFATNERIDTERKYFPDVAPGNHLCQVIVGGPDLLHEPLPKSLITILHSAKRRIWISTGYFVPDLLLLSALQICGARGIDVRLIVSAVTDHKYLLQVGRSFYNDLLQFGIRVFEYFKGLNHAKTILVDDDWFSVGSANFDNRSMRINFELNLFIHCRKQAQVLEAMMQEDFEGSREITLQDIKGRSFFHRLGEAALRPLAPLL